MRIQRFSSFFLPATLFLAACLSGEQASAQSIPTRADSLQAMLCKVWVMDYMLADGLRILKSSEEPDLRYEFLPDHRFTRSRGNDPLVQGTWARAGAKKEILLRSGNKVFARLLSLEPEELVLTEPGPGRAAHNMQMVFHIRKP